HLARGVEQRGDRARRVEVVVERRREVRAEREERASVRRGGGVGRRGRVAGGGVRLAQPLQALRRGGQALVGEVGDAAVVRPEQVEAHGHRVEAREQVVEGDEVVLRLRHLLAL